MALLAAVADEEEFPAAECIPLGGEFLFADVLFVVRHGGTIARPKIFRQAAGTSWDAARGRARVRVIKGQCPDRRPSIIRRGRGFA